MNRILIAASALALTAGAGWAQQLNLYNWGNYTNPELIEKFEAETGIEVTITDFDSNDTALAKVKAGGHGFDLVVPSHTYVPIWIEEGLLMEARPDQMENFEHMDPQWVDVEWDPGRKFTVPWQWGTTGVAVNTEHYKGDINTSAIFMDPPEELRGKINVVPEMNDVMTLAVMYHGGEPCTGDREVLKKVHDSLMSAKEHWLGMEYGNVEKLTDEDYWAAVNWNGSTFRARKQNPDVAYGYPKEGYPVWMDSVALLKDAQNIEEAKTFMNFIMAPDTAALISEFARYANGIVGSEEFMSEEMTTAPEIVIPADLKAAGKFNQTCPPEVQQLYTRIWTDLQK